MDTAQRKNPMGTSKISSYLIRSSIPLMLSLLANSLYMLIDSIFVSHISEEALAALAMAVPVQGLVSALGAGIAVGLNAALSKAMGENDGKKVQDVASAAMFLGVCAWLLIAVSGILFIRPFFAWQAKGNQGIYQYGVTYMLLYMVMSLGLMGQWVFDRFLIATGKSVGFLITLSTAAVVNLILDPILIFGYLGCPPLGATGAAIATICGQFAGALMGVYLMSRYKVIPLRFTWKPSLAAIREIMKVGIPTFLMQSVISLFGIWMNAILRAFSAVVVAVLGICIRVVALVMIAPNGINNGLIPLIAYNYGAKRGDRVVESIRWARIYAYALMGTLSILIMVFPRTILQLFDVTEELLQFGVPALRIYTISNLVAVFSLVSSTSYQALGCANYSLVLMMARQAVLPVLFAMLLSRTGNVDVIWFAYLVSELCVLPVTLAFNRKIRRKIKALGNEPVTIEE